MLDRCKEVLFKTYNAEEKKWIFLSGFDENKKLVVSQWIVDSDQPLRETIEQVYNKEIAPVLPKLRYIVIDVVNEIISFPDAQKLLTLDPKVYWIVIEDLEDDNIGIILPNIAWVTDMKQVLFDLKKKYWIHGKAAISWFTTTRIIVSK